MGRKPARITLSTADERDRESIYGLRHQVYAGELRQHPENATGLLIDKLDAVNVCLVAKIGEDIAGFISITPPSELGYSIDKYFAREDLPLLFDCGLYEVRLLTVAPAHRGTTLAVLLMYGALRYIESLSATTVAAIGRLEVLEMYKRAGLTSLGLRAKSGDVTYELMAAKVCDLRTHLAVFENTLSRLERLVDWQVNGLTFRHDDGCYHGGASFAALGEEFDTLERKDIVINADGLDAWFDPAPSVVQQLAESLPFSLKTSPPTYCEGMRRVIARARGVTEDAILPGAGSSNLIFAGLRHWVQPASRVLILDPMYGEYAHVLEKVIGARVERLTLSRARSYEVDVDELRARAARGYDWIMLVNPNSPTGRHLPREGLEKAFSSSASNTRWWIDETYIEYVGADQSLEGYASTSTGVVICKSMSKVYALSGARAAYLCGPPGLVNELKPPSPPWSVSLPAQIAACEALRNDVYYRERWEETHALRGKLAADLRALGWEVHPGCANFLLCHLPERQPEAVALVAACRAHNLFARDVSNMGTGLGARALRIAVKDAKTNHRMLEILRLVLAEIAGGAQWRAA